MQPVNPEESRPLVEKENVLAELANLKDEVKRLRAQATIPVFKAIKDELIQRIQSGKLTDELSKKKISSLLKDVSELKKILEDTIPQVAIITPPAPASEGKDQTWQRAHSPMNISEKDRAARRAAIEGQVVKE